MANLIKKYIGLTSEERDAEIGYRCRVIDVTIPACVIKFHVACSVKLKFAQVQLVEMKQRRLHSKVTKKNLHVRSCIMLQVDLNQSDSSGHFVGH